MRYFAITNVAAKVNFVSIPGGAIVDTGASGCALSLEAVKQFGLQKQMEEPKCAFKGAEGRVEWPLGYLRGVPIKIGPLEIRVNAHVLDGGNYMMLLGDIL